MRGKMKWIFNTVPPQADNLIVMIDTGEYYPAHSVGGEVHNDVVGFISPIPANRITAWVQDAKLHNAVVGAYLDYIASTEGGPR